MPVIRVLVIALVVILSHSPGHVAGDEVSNTRYQNLLNEYLRADTEAKRLQEIADVLRHAIPRDTLRKDLTQHVGKPETRVRALELATELQVDRLHKKIQKDIDGPAEAAAVAYLFKTQDPGSTDQLYDRWASKPIDSESYKLVNDGFRANFVRIATLEKFLAYMKKKGSIPEKIDAAKAILLYQMDAKPDDPSVDFEKAWKKFRDEDLQDDRRFTFEKDKLVLPWDDFWKTGRIRKCNNENLKLYPGATLELYAIPDLIQDSIIYVKCSMRVLGGNGAKFALHAGGQAPGPLIKDGRWVLSTTGQDRPKSQVEIGVWERLTLYYLADRQTAEPYDRPQGVITVETKLTYEVGAMNGKFEKLVITAGEATVVVGGMHFHFKP